VPLYLQLIEQVKHAIETGALRVGDQLPAIRRLAEDLVINPNTVVRAYRELEHEAVIEIRHGSGAYISESEAGRVRIVQRGRVILQTAIEKLISFGLTEPEIRRLVDNELSLSRVQQIEGVKHE
jgi:GntR family transcriptional regulator